MPIAVAECVFCQRVTRTRGHHIVPRSKGGKLVRPTCESCEDFIHKTWSHAELRDQFDTVEKVRADPRYQRFLAWLLKQDARKIFRTRRPRRRSASAENR